MTAKRHDYIPRKDADFTNWLANLVQYVSDKNVGVNASWDFISQSAMQELRDAHQDWVRNYVPALKPHTPAVTAAKNDARKRVNKIVRNFVQRFLHWSPVSNADRVNMGIPNRDIIRTPHYDVGEIVEFEIGLQNSRELKIKFWIKGDVKKAKPTSYDGAVFIYDVLDAPPSSHDELKRHTMASRTPLTLYFDETERGKTVYIAAAWQNQRSNIGRWCDIQSAVIP
jgi:hypothetical protein